MKLPRNLLICAVAAVGACHGDSGTPPSPPTPHASAPAVVKKGPSAEQLTAGMVEAASQGKSSGLAKLKFELQQRPKLGQTLDINIAIMPQIDASAADIQIAGGDGLTVPPGTNQIALPAVVAGQVYRQSVQVTPAAEGVLLLNLTLLLKHDELTDAQPFSIPLIVDR